MFKNLIQKSSSFLAGFGVAVFVLGFAGLVTANSFSGPSNTPPNGFISPVFDGLEVNGDFIVNPGPGDSVNMKNVYIDGLEVDRLAGCFGCDSAENFAGGSQYLRITSPVIDISSTDIDMGSISSGAKVDIWSHVEARSIGYMYEVNANKSLSNEYAGRFHSAVASCSSTTYLVSCNAYLWDSGRDYRYEGTTTTSNRNCYGYARQDETTAANATLYVEATCWDPDNSYNKNF